MSYLSTSPVVNHNHPRSPTLLIGRHSPGRSTSSSPELGSVSPGGSRSSYSPGRSACSCAVCGKQYKHRSCLNKHLWEHHDAWEACLKYNLTKHQQVQMMEAAQVLVDMMAVKSS
ncbi:hypothetical protein IW140_000957 [Coemansia sp. RSA 1813]|nr:hypothetical protein EV178_004817 [Coemansia sp. RSA 1646]KAJ1773373.1 hypothetical protein LPJ74_000626 [Coemansia sp. RSA 1843]KAJ2091591.1 hypothetical protein IW138_001819 [Coemansia sp. RSA 986]KAJ2212378.1 hypothetical protein EV179_004703 [Coemansia sp. RSA 487]KAJ2572208.1 hypothetical protein IW140_000957 [Coemansia sp. RSA 1813]